MIDPERLQRVATELANAVNEREQGRQVRLPVIQRADAAALTNLMHGQLDDAIARRDSEIGSRMACSKGCNSCCVSPVLITEGEAIAIAEWLREPEHADVRARFEAAYPAWRDQLGDLLAQNADQRSAEETRAWCLLVQQRQAMCAFNYEGACSIYPVRPALCRKAHALDTNQYCNNDGGKVQYYQHPETENIYEEQRPMKFALHMALRPNGRLDLIGYAVHRLLGGTAAGRNDPCPCGSGKKYKKCCGAAAK
jgi:Fe-S-cluster containining protein